MRLPHALHNRIQYLLERTDALRSGQLKADPRWLDCIDKVIRDAPSDAMRTFFTLFFCQGASCDDIQFQLFIERSTLYAWRNYFLWNVALEAASAGLLTVKE